MEKSSDHRPATLAPGPRALRATRDKSTGPVKRPARRSPKPSRIPLQVVDSIPLFNDLPPNKVKRILKLCRVGSYAAGDMVCVADRPSHDMHILFTGELTVVTPEGLRVGKVQPVSTVGELALILDRPGTVNLRASKKSKTLIFGRDLFRRILHADRDTEVKIQRNMIAILSERLMNESVRKRDHETETLRLADQDIVQNMKLDAALGLLAEEMGVSVDAAAGRVEEQFTTSCLQHVLIVDDEAAARRIMAEALPTCEVREAADGPEALEAVENEEPDLVITDLKMPDMNGFRLLMKLRHLHPDLPVIAISGYLEEEKMVGHKFDGYLQKPFALADFRSMVLDALSASPEAAALD